jgi:hypothetical protein
LEPQRQQPSLGLLQTLDSFRDRSTSSSEATGRTLTVLEAYDGPVRAIRDALAQAVIGTFGVLFGILSAAALAVAAFIPALLGLLAFIFSPVRALVDRVRGEAPR